MPHFSVRAGGGELQAQGTAGVWQDGKGRTLGSNALGWETGEQFDGRSVIGQPWAMDLGPKHDGTLHLVHCETQRQTPVYSFMEYKPDFR